MIFQESQRIHVDFLTSAWRERHILPCLYIKTVEQEIKEYVRSSVSQKTELPKAPGIWFWSFEPETSSRPFPVGWGHCRYSGWCWHSTPTWIKKKKFWIWKSAWSGTALLHSQQVEIFVAKTPLFREGTSFFVVPDYFVVGPLQATQPLDGVCVWELRTLPVQTPKQYWFAIWNYIKVFMVRVETEEKSHGY